MYYATGYTQNTFPTAVNTNVGIGTISPSTRLQITSSTAGTSGVRLTNMTSATSTTTGNSKALSVDSSGNIILTPVLNTAIYRFLKTGMKNLLKFPSSSRIPVSLKAMR